MYYSLLTDGLWPDDEELAKSIEVELDGMIMEIKVDSINSGEIVRVISSNPNNYLNAQYQPGTKIEFKPIISD